MRSESRDYRRGPRLARPGSGRPGAVKRGDIYIVSLDPTMGHEQQGTRPVLLVSPDRFNTFTGVPIVVPITTGGSFARNAGFTVSLAEAGIPPSGGVRVDQPHPP